jgi:transglutaminase-like putative cysteine protease
LQALPVMLILFVLFPRIAGPLWKLPEDGRGASTGLSDTMSPGDVTNLSKSDEVAFRVEFDGPPPPADALYWRGPVLADYDGRTWRQLKVASSAPTVEAIGDPVRYSVLLEPHNQRWLFALDVPLAAPPGARADGALTLLAATQVHERQRYTVHSSPQYRLDPSLSPDMRRHYLSLPSHAHPKARALAAEWRARGLSDGEIVGAAAAFFRSQPFVYTLRPAPLPLDPVDQFLFETQRGFCEHYASAFTVLMRAAGVPARVVTGYQGGELNPLGDYMIVRQSDAHAWTEVWLEGHGWTRLDPTALVAPHRIERGLADAVPAGDPVPFLARSGGLLKALNLQWDAVNNGWNRWVLGYGPELQRQVLARAGLGDWLETAAALAVAIAVALSVTAILLLRQRVPDADPLAADYARFCRKLERQGLGRRPSEGPQAYAARVASARPELAAQVEAITHLYTRLRYGGQSAERAERLQLRRYIREFSP